MKSFADFIRNWFLKLKEWMQPNAADPLLLQLLKFIGKCIALLVLIALSPIILVVLLFVFMAAF
ncbi:MAG TPA: hypothetical protein VGN63_10620 [Flavisolibacter sp.]|jgi:hypothetical protein|nr:hypothetical protein [Flavisolibacter sp.]